MYQYEGRTFAEEEDLCLDCTWATSSERLCPLMKSLALNEIAICSGSLVLAECDFYEKSNSEE